MTSLKNRIHQFKQRFTKNFRKYCDPAELKRRLSTARKPSDISDSLSVSLHSQPPEINKLHSSHLSTSTPNTSLLPYQHSATVSPSTTKSSPTTPTLNGCGSKQIKYNSGGMYSHKVGLSKARDSPPFQTSTTPISTVDLTTNSPPQSEPGPGNSYDNPIDLTMSSSPTPSEDDDKRVLQTFREEIASLRCKNCDGEMKMTGEEVIAATKGMLLEAGE